MNDKKKYTVDNSTVASNPGNVTLKPLVWIKHNFKEVAVLTFSLLLSIVVSIRISHYFGVLVAMLLIINIFYWIRKKEHFHADSNGGIVISIHPPLVAVHTNLTKFGSNHPVIKVIEFNVNRKIRLGEKIATVALYSVGDNEGKNFWEDFHPIPVEYATNNQSEITQALNSYPEKQWISIKQGISELKKPYKIGLYRIQTNNSDWT